MENNDIQFGSEDTGTAEKKETRPGAFIVLALAVLGGGGYLFYKHGPASASAATPTAATTSDAQRSIAEFLQVKDGDINSIQKGLSNTERVVKQFNSYASMTQIPLGELSSNPFKVDVPQTAAADSAVTKANAADEALKKATEDAANLKIESIVIGRKNPSSAMINGLLVRTGDRIGAFKVESIKPGLVILTDGHHHFERRINQ